MKAYSFNETILVAASAPALRASVAKVLREDGYTVLEAGNGHAAERIWTEGRGSIDLILITTTLPKLGGRQWIDRMRRRDPNIKAIYMPGPVAELARVGKLRYDDLVLRQGFTSAELRAMVRGALDSSRPAESGYACVRSRRPGMTQGRNPGGRFCLRK